MCGVFGYVGDDTGAAEIVLAGLRRLEYRGYDSWGVVVSPLNGGSEDSSENNSKNGPAKKLAVKKQPGKIGSAGVAELPAGTIALGHTRWATHGGVTTANSHPHLDCTGQVAVVHNGIIENFQTLKTDLQAAGHVFQSETDTEVVAHLVEDALKVGLDLAEAVRQSFQKLTGQNAIAVLHRSAQNEANQVQTLIAVRQGSPLVLGLGKGEQFIASDPAALLPHTKEVYFLEDGELAEITAKGLTIRSVATGKKLAWQSQILTDSAASTELGEFQHFLQKEIHEQPAVLRRVATTDLTKLQQLANQIQAADQIWLVACGSAGFAAEAGAEFLATVAGKLATAVIASEFSSKLALITSKTLVIGVSQSGETMDVLNVLKLARQQGATLAALVNVVGSSLYRLVDSPIALIAGPELAVATTKAFSSQIAHLLLLTQTLVGQPKQAQADLKKAATAIDQILEAETYQQIQKLAKTLEKTQDLFVIGRGLGVTAAHEAALKLKETAYIHAEGMAAGELKHGSLALIETGTPCIVFVPADATQQATLSAAMELKARGGRVIGVAAQPQAVFDDYIAVPDCGLATIIAQIVVVQILAYELALLRKIDPDKPRNLAKSVTVG